MDKTFKERLESLQSEFAGAGEQFPGLRLDLLEDHSGIALNNKGWEAIRTRSWPAPPDTKWDHFPDGRFLARFYGNLKGCSEFKRLASKAYNLFCDTDTQLVRKDSHCGWIKIIHDMAFHCPSSCVHFDRRFWGHDGPLDFKARAELPDRRWKHDGMSLPSNPRQLVFDGCLFGISAAALQMFLTPYGTAFLPKETGRFRLAPWQFAVVFFNTVVLERPVSELAGSGIRELAVRMLSLTDRLDVPWFMEWANDSGVLRLGFQVLHNIKARSRGPCRILREFERQGWPELIDNPFGTGAKALNVARDFVRKMKKDQKVWPQIKFKQQNSGAVITWRLLQQPESPEQKQAGNG